MAWKDAFILMTAAFALMVVAFITAVYIEWPRAELAAYQEGQEACMEWYGIDPYQEEANAHNLPEVD